MPFPGERLLNGTFTGAATYWTLGTGWAYGSNKAQKNADGTGTLSQIPSPPIIPGKTYKLVFDVLDWTVGDVVPSLGGVTGTTRSANGTYTQNFLATNYNGVSFAPTDTSRFSIDNASVTEVTALYDKAKLGLGNTMVQKNDAGNEGKWAGPAPVGLLRPMEAAIGIPCSYPFAIRWSDNIDWIFLADILAAATTRRIVAASYNRTTGVIDYKGYITGPAAAAARTIRAMRMRYEKYTTGTASASGTAVTGTGTAWSASRLCVGSRIGFGSIVPSEITTWYQISAIGSDTGITLTASAGTIADGPYVIEELWVLTAETNATTTLGGLYAWKGLRWEDFATGGTAIPAATTVDNIKAVYHLRDNATQTNTVAFGMGIEPADSWTQHFVWIADTLTTAKLYKYNIKAALTVSGGTSENAYVLTSGASAAVSGTTSQANNGRIVNPNHGPGAGIKCFYFTTTTRVYRSKDVTTITNADAAWLSGGDYMAEVPPGSANTFLATSLQNCIEFASNIDRFIILNTAAASQRSYVTNYRTDAGQYERIFLSDTKQINQAAADGDTTPHPAIIITAFSGWAEDGILYLASVGLLITSNFLYAIPIGADWEYAAASNGRLILPSMSTPNCTKFVQGYLNEVNILGGKTGMNLGMPLEAYRMYFRTTGITDNSGSWTLLDSLQDLSSLSGADEIQFMIEFRIIGPTCIPARILSIGVLYEDNSTLSNYQPCADLSDKTNKRFAWRFATAFGGTVPTLRVRLYNAVTDGLLVDDNTASPTGTFEKSTNGGGAWSAYDTSDKANDTTFIRYTPASLGDSIQVRALLTLN
jgi:hypothetical protein